MDIDYNVQHFYGFPTHDGRWIYDDDSTALRLYKTEIINNCHSKPPHMTDDYPGGHPILLSSGDVDFDDKKLIEYNSIVVVHYPLYLCEILPKSINACFQNMWVLTIQHLLQNSLFENLKEEIKKQIKNYLDQPNIYTHGPGFSALIWNKYYDLVKLLLTENCFDIKNLKVSFSTRTKYKHMGRVHHFIDKMIKCDLDINDFRLYFYIGSNPHIQIQFNTEENSNIQYVGPYTIFEGSVRYRLNDVLSRVPWPDKIDRILIQQYIRCYDGYKSEKILVRLCKWEYKKIMALPLPLESKMALINDLYPCGMQRHTLSRMFATC